MAPTRRCSSKLCTRAALLPISLPTPTRADSGDCCRVQSGDSNAPSHHLDRPSNRRDLVEPDRKAQAFALEPVEAHPMLIEAWLCQKTEGARRPSAVGLTQVLRRRAALRGSLGLRLLRKLLTNPLAQPRSM